MKHYNLTYPRLVSTVTRLAFCVAARFAAHVSLPQSADRPVTVETRERVKLTDPDRSLVEKVMRMSMDNVEMSRVALERTSNPRVRALADAMAADHTALSKELGAVAATKGVTLPAKDTISDKWVKRDAKDFDVEYLKKIVA